MELQFTIVKYSVYLLWMIVLWNNQLMAQDLIVTTSGDTINCKIKSVGNDTISYLSVIDLDHELMYLNISELKTYMKNGRWKQPQRINPALNKATVNTYYVSFFTSTLFDCDSSNIEYAIASADYSTFPSSQNVVSIYRTDGTRIFHRDSANIWQGTLPLGRVRTFIQNADNGAKMMLDLENGDVEVWDLCDSVPTGYSMAKAPLSGDFDLLSYPNPGSSHTTIKYSLPEGLYQGEIVFYNSSGAEIKRFLVDRNFNTLEISTQDLKSGAYYYILVTAEGRSEGQKHVIIK